MRASYLRSNVKAVAAAALAAALSGGPHARGEELDASLRPKVVVVNGAEIQYVEQGKGETVLFLHSAGTDWRIWQAVRPYVAARYRFVAYSRRHHHPNAWPDDGSSHHVAQHVEDLAALIRQLGVNRVHLVAVSLGGHVAARMLLRHPELVANAVFSDALLAWPDSDESKPVLEAFMSRFAPLRSAVRAGDEQGAVTALLDWITADSEGWQKLSGDRQRLYRDNARTLLLMAHESAPPLRCSDFERVHSPVLVMAGDSTPRAFRLTNEQLLACLPGSAEYSVLPGAGHFWYSSHPEAAARRMLDFFGQHPIVSTPSNR